MTTEFDGMRIDGFYPDLRHPDPTAAGIFRDPPTSLLIPGDDYWENRKGGTNWRRAEHQQQACIVVAAAAHSSLGPMAAHFCLDELYEPPQSPSYYDPGPDSAESDWWPYIHRTMEPLHAAAERACDQEVMDSEPVALLLGTRVRHVDVKLEDTDGIFTARGVDQLDDGPPPDPAQPGWAELAAQRWRTAILVSLKEDDDVRALVAAFLDAERALSETTEGGGVFHGLAPLQRLEYEPGDPEWVEISSIPHPQAWSTPQFFIGIAQQELDAAMTPPPEELSPEGQLDAAMDVVVGDRVEQAAERISAELMGAVQQLPWMPAPEVVSTQDVKALLLTLLEGKHLDPTEPWRNRQQLQPLRDMLRQLANDEQVWELLGEADKP